MAAAELAKTFRVLHQTVGHNFDQRDFFFNEFLLTNVGHRGENGCHGVLAVAIPACRAAHPIEVGTHIAYQFAVLIYATVNEGDDHVVPTGNDVGGAVARAVQVFGYGNLDRRKAREKGHHALRIRRIRRGVQRRAAVG